MFDHKGQFWRLSEKKGSQGLSCNEDGLFLGDTPLLEWQSDRFVARSKIDLEALLSRGFGFEVSLDRVIGGLETVASALTTGDLCRARIAAVHLRIPNLPDMFARLDMQLEDIDLKLDRISKTTAGGDWDPAKHPRAGTAPNPGWFAPTDGGESDNASTTLVSDHASDDGRLHLPPGERNDEIGDLLEWIANAKPEDVPGINSEIDRLFYQVGDFQDGNALHHALATVLANPNDTTRQQVLDDYEPITHRDNPGAGADLTTDLATGALFGPALKPAEAGASVAGAAAEGAEVSEEAASEVWKLGWAARGNEIEDALTADMRGIRTGPSYPVIDFLEEDGTAVSIKSIDLNAATYQDVGRLSYRIDAYVQKLADFEGASYGQSVITNSQIANRTLDIAIPKGSMTPIQKGAIDAAIARTKDAGITLKITPF